MMEETALSAGHVTSFA